MKEIFDLIKKMEDEIGNGCWVNLSRIDNVLIFNVYWLPEPKFKYSLYYLNIEEVISKDYLVEFIINEAIAAYTKYNFENTWKDVE